MPDPNSPRDAFHRHLIEYIDIVSCVPWDQVMPTVEKIMAIYDEHHPEPALHAVIRHDDNGNNVVVQCDMSEADATALHDTLAATAHKQWFEVVSYHPADRVTLLAQREILV